MSRNETVCGWAEEIPGLLLGEIPAARATEVEQHIAVCAACAAQRAAFSRVLFRMRAAPAEQPVRDLSPEILARRPVTEALWQRRSFWLRAAALLLATAGIGSALLWNNHRVATFDLASTVPAVRISNPVSRVTYPPADKAAAVAQALAWLERTQEADGHWDTARWGAQRMYTVGLTSLALLALAADEHATPQQRAALTRGLDWLVAQQDARGQFGADGSAAMYNHSMATLALLEGVALETNAAHRTACERALACITGAQRASGGWGYSRGAAENVNTAITVWQLQALLRAEALGFAQVRPYVASGLAWLGGRIGAEGRVGYRHADDFPNGAETLTAAGALCLLRSAGGANDPRIAQMLACVRGTAAQPDTLDFYRGYFVSSALAAAGGGADPALEKIRAAVLSRQTHDGSEAGSWTPADRWGRAGGRIYATALAILALQAG
ncbi:MAG: zf-HC2 domain-containing protein [Kiritimatiellaeota bacterium]|nr:zf-HC2 domain-containing protein [Kiritimatiellota bacterium]